MDYERMDYEIAYAVTYYWAVEDSLRVFLKAREKTMRVLTDISLEMQEEGKVASRRRAVCSATSLASTLGSLALTAAAPVTGGASGVAAVALAGVGGVSKLSSIGASFKQKIVEKGLLKKAEIVLDADRKATERLHAAAGALRDMASLSGEVVKVAKAAQCSLNAVRGAVDCSRSLRVIDLLSQGTATAQKVASLTRSGLIIASIPLDILAILSELKDSKAGNISSAAKAVWEQFLALQKEYETAKSAYKDVRVLLKAMRK